MNEIIIGIFIMIGSFFILVAAIGILRFNDIFSRLHATTKATSFGILLVITGVVVFFLNITVLLKALLIIFFIYLTAPLAAHSIAKSFKQSDSDKKES